MGLCRLKERDYQQAIKHFKEASNIQAGDVDKNPGINDGQAQAHECLGEFDEALYQYGDAIRADPENTQFLMNRSLCYSKQQKYDLAIEDLITGQKHNPSDPQLLYRLGLAYYANNDYKFNNGKSIWIDNVGFVLTRAFDHCL